MSCPRSFTSLSKLLPLPAPALALLAALSVSGCAGGGGGPGGSAPPFGSGYPTLANATAANTGDGIALAYTSLQASNEFDQASAATIVVAPNTPSTGRITVSVSGVAVPGGTEPDFTFEVDTAALAVLANSPLTGGSLAPECQDCLTSGTVTADDGRLVSFTYLDPEQAGLTYSTLGLWSKPSDVSTSELGGAFSLGVVTRGNDLPTSGSASYAGFFIGRYATSDTVTVGAPAVGIYAVGANATAQANFGTGTVAFQTLNTQIRLEGAGLGPAQAASHLNLNASGLPITGTTGNLFTGPVTTSALTGTISGAFYGRPDTATSVPPEMGGVVSVTNAGGSQTMVGGFALKVQ